MPDARIIDQGFSLTIVFKQFAALKHLIEKALTLVTVVILPNLNLLTLLLTFLGKKADLALINKLVTFYSMSLSRPTAS